MTKAKLILSYSKAFDKVPHHLLLHKLKHHGIRGKVLDWIADFLSGCSQHAFCGGHSSESIYIVLSVVFHKVVRWGHY